MKTISQMASEMGKKGGKNSVKSRFAGKTKTEISEIMRNVRYSKKDIRYGNDFANMMVETLNSKDHKKGA
jgi:hypothetical protein